MSLDKMSLDKMSLDKKRKLWLREILGNYCGNCRIRN
jgi:hypothetical protein